ncbi:hypothetical protein G6677_07930 [Polynucleobacter paneuropaeus]|nr:hypothetical protein [Polynucleobacter paneuropaeus]
MKIKEVTNPEEQLGLLRVIIDNTWSAIKQQADTQARQRAAKPVKTKPKVVKTPKKPPYAPQPKPLPKPPQQLAQPKQVAPKPATVRTPDELKAFQDHLRGEKFKTALTNQNRTFPQEPPTL